MNVTTRRAVLSYLSIIALVLAALVAVAYLTYRDEPGITWTDEIPAATPLIGVTPDKKIVIHRGTALGEYCTEVWREDWKRRTRNAEPLTMPGVDPEWDGSTAYAFGYLDGYCAEYLELDPALEGGR